MSTSVTNLCLGPIHNVVSCIFPEPATLLLALLASVPLKMRHS